MQFALRISYDSSKLLPFLKKTSRLSMIWKYWKDNPQWNFNSLLLRFNFFWRGRGEGRNLSQTSTIAITWLQGTRLLRGLLA